MQARLIQTNLAISDADPAASPNKFGKIATACDFTGLIKKFEVN